MLHAGDLLLASFEKHLRMQTEQLADAYILKRAIKLAVKVDAEEEQAEEEEEAEEETEAPVVEEPVLIVYQPTRGDPGASMKEIAAVQEGIAAAYAGLQQQGEKARRAALLILWEMYIEKETLAEAAPAGADMEDLSAWQAQQRNAVTAWAKRQYTVKKGVSWTPELEQLLQQTLTAVEGRLTVLPDMSKEEKEEWKGMKLKNYRCSGAIPSAKDRKQQKKQAGGEGVGGYGEWEAQEKAKAARQKRKQAAAAARAAEAAAARAAALPFPLPEPLLSAYLQLDAALQDPARNFQQLLVEKLGLPEERVSLDLAAGLLGVLTVFALSLPFLMFGGGKGRANPAAVAAPAAASNKQ